MCVFITLNELSLIITVNLLQTVAVLLLLLLLLARHINRQDVEK